MEAPRITLRDIAQRLNVSHVTVSLALRNHLRISEAVRKKVHAIAKELGYRPDPMLTVLSDYRIPRTNETFNCAIAWINSWPKPSHLRQYKEFDAYWRGASSSAEKFGYRLEEFAISPNLKGLEATLAGRKIAGILLPPGEFGVERLLKDFHWNDFAVVRIGRSWSFPASHVVTSDQFQSGQLAFQKAVDYGYTRIGFIGQRNPARQFVAGYLFGQSQQDKLEKIPPLLFENNTSGEESTLRWLTRHKPDVVITEDAGMPDLLSQHHYKIPEDLALAGLSFLDGHIDAGIDQQSAEIGQVAISKIVSLINEHHLGCPAISNQTLIPGTWVDGNMMPNKACGSAK